MKIISFDDEEYRGMAINTYNYDNTTYVQFVIFYKDHIEMTKDDAIKMLKKAIKRLEEIK